MRTLSIDLETYSPIPIKAGAAAYVNSPEFEILLMAYRYDAEPVQLVDLAQGEQIPPQVIKDLYNSAIIKRAYNANFEVTCLDKKMAQKMDLTQWRCSAVLALTMGLPGNLAEVARVMGLGEDKQKMAVGKQLIRYFCLPCKATKANGGRVRNLPQHAPDKWAVFRTYCMQDVVAESAIADRLAPYAPNDTEQQLWVLDQEITRRGVKIDTTLARHALEADEKAKGAALLELQHLTGLANPASVIQFKTWLNFKLAGSQVDSVAKGTLEELLKTTGDAEVKRAIYLKLLISKTSTRKYQAMLDSVCADGRLHGVLQFYGANRTGRWAGRIVQVQNLPKNHMPDLDDARQLLLQGRYQDIELLWGNTPDVLSQLIRTAFIAKEGSRFIVADYSAIEARVIAWLAGETWRQDIFKDNGDIYCASASQMFKVPVVKHGINGELRQKGKVAELALGYQGGPGALKAMGAIEMGLTEEELPGIVSKWRAASPHIVQLWRTYEEAATMAVTGKTSARAAHGLLFMYERGQLFIRLPSGRRLCYIRPAMGVNRFDAPSLTYQGMDQTTKKWQTLETYGGKLVENVVQATARDCLAWAMLRLAKAGYKVLFHVHDEVIIEAPLGEGSLKDVISIMSEPTTWSSGLLLTADGYETTYYKKD